jgi:hypothetical protein
MALLPDLLNGTADLGKCSDEEHLCITIKRDWLESFLGPFSDNGEFGTSTLETTAPVSETSEFDSDSPIVTAYGQPGKEKGKQRMEAVAPQKETGASLDVGNVEECLAGPSTLLSDEEAVPDGATGASLDVRPPLFGVSDSPIVTAYGQPGKEKGKQRLEKFAPQKETGASLDVGNVEECLAGPSTLLSDEEAVPDGATVASLDVRPPLFGVSDIPIVTAYGQPGKEKGKQRLEKFAPQKETGASLDVGNVEECVAGPSTLLSDEEAVPDGATGASLDVRPPLFGVSDSPIVTAYGQPGKEKGKQRLEKFAPQKETVASLDNGDVEDCLASSSTSSSGVLPLPREQQVGSYEHDDDDKGSALSSTSDPRRKSKIPQGVKRSTSSAKDVLKGGSVRERRELRKRGGTK